MRELSGQLDGEAARERARRLTADLLGRALTGFQGVVSETDALKHLLAADLVEGESGEQPREAAGDLRDGASPPPRVELGLEDLEDVL
jgi:hypothetical protein